MRYKLSGLSIREKFELRFIPEPNSGCWLWEGNNRSNDSGSMTYGRFSFTDENGREVRKTASRVSYEIYVGPIPEGMFVCHKCDTPLCVNPSHLFIGTRQDNIDDMERKGRNKVPTGSKHPCTKLTESDVWNMCELFLYGGMSRHDVASYFGVTYNTVKQIFSGKSFKYAPRPQGLKRMPRTPDLNNHSEV